jgi:hypothetical protein
VSSAATQLDAHTAADVDPDAAAESALLSWTCADAQPAHTNAQHDHDSGADVECDTRSDSDGDANASYGHADACTVGHADTYAGAQPDGDDDAHANTHPRLD